MTDYNILTGQLHTGLDTPYDEDLNKIDVYSSVYWTAANEKEYGDKEDLIDAYTKDTDLFSIRCWCDISGYKYWVIQQEEENYVSIDVYLKKKPSEYTQEEMKIISEAIMEVDEYFDGVLM